MDNNENKRLMNLPESTKVLVNQGVYSLYTLKQAAADTAFALFANQDIYILKLDGTVFKKQSSDTPIEVAEPVSFPELKMPFSLKVNSFAS